MKQQVLDLTDPVDGFLRDAKYLILDRDPVFSKDVKGRLEDEGVKVVTFPAKSPNLNAYAERFVLSIKSECLSKIIPLGERHLRHCVQEFTRHYHEERPHQGLGNRLIEPAAAANGGGPRFLVVACPNLAPAPGSRLCRWPDCSPTGLQICSRDFWDRTPAGGFAWRELAAEAREPAELLVYAL